MAPACNLVVRACNLVVLADRMVVLACLLATSAFLMLASDRFSVAPARLFVAWAAHVLDHCSILNPWQLVLWGCMLMGSIMAWHHQFAKPPCTGHRREYGLHVALTLLALYSMLPCTKASEVPGLYSVQHVPSHRRELQTAVSTTTGLTSALANTAVGRIVLASGTYYLIAELNITRSVILEAAVAGTVVLDAQASSSSLRRVLYINPGSLGVVQLIGLSITGGHVQNVRATETCKFPIAPMGHPANGLASTFACTTAADAPVNYRGYMPQRPKISHRPDGRLTFCFLFAGRRCLHLLRNGHDNVFLDLREYSQLCACSCSKVPIAPTGRLGKLLTCLPDGKVADALALTHACTTANASFNYSLYEPQRP